MQDLTFIHCESGDLDHIIDTYSQAANALSAAGIRQWRDGYPDLETLTSDIANREMYKLVANGSIAGLIVINAEFSDAYAAAGWSIINGQIAGFHRLCIPVAIQGRGFGYKVMAAAEAEARTLGYTSVRLDTHIDNAAANALYKKLGYKYAGRIRYSRPDLNNCYEKSLVVL